MEGSNLLQGVGLFVCVGAIVLIAVIAFAARALMKNRNRDQQSTMWNTRGEEQPQYDDPNVESRGGFGNVPATGRRDPDPNTNTRQSGFGGPPQSGAPKGGAQSYDRDRKDDDDVRSSGGFGGG